ncbi:MAG: diguanylate cyclase [Kordiimonadaceae bacterium]|nr:diguanylate cyclase [Kordiimonadaceae bacterium]
MNPLKRLNHKEPSLQGAVLCAISVDDTGVIIDQSDSAGPLANLWQAGEKTLKDIVGQAFDTGLPIESRLTTDDKLAYWLVATPQLDRVLVVARDTTLSDTVTQALMDSRSLLKDLLDAAVDFSFEVDAQQKFIFVFPKEVYGIQAGKLAGQDANKVFWPAGNVPARNPFTTTVEKVFDSVAVEVGNEKRDVVFSVRPRTDSSGKITGVCGTCRDVTARVKKERKTKRDNLRLAVQQRVTQILNASDNAQELLENASRELVDVLRADQVWAVVRRNDGLVPAAVHGGTKQVLDLEGIWQTLASSDRKLQGIEIEGQVYLAIRLERQGVGIGMLIIGRNTPDSPWSAQEKQLLDQIADILTAAFMKAELIDKLSHLSGRDELTGLLNRRALRELVERRLLHQRRTGTAGCIAFIDLDHFKEVNDTLGHKAGDEAIKMVADFLQQAIRPIDYAGRVGGDEFVLWIDDANENTAAEKARGLLDYMPEVRKALGNEKLGLGASVGICRSVAGVDFDFTMLTDRADAALYQVKKSGKNDIAYADKTRAEGSADQPKDTEEKASKEGDAKNNDIGGGDAE